MFFFGAYGTDEVLVGATEASGSNRCGICDIKPPHL
jgi:hypothetical protein